MQVQGLRKRSAAFTRVDLILVGSTLAIIILLTLSAFSQARDTRRQRICLDNLKVIGGAFISRANNGENQRPFASYLSNGHTNAFVTPSQYFGALSNEIKSPACFVCPATRLQPATNWTSFTDKNVSYFFNLSAGADHPKSFLSGDSGFWISGLPPQTNRLVLPATADITYPRAIHRSKANILLGGGTETQFPRWPLQTALRNSGVATNLILLPK